MKKTALFIAFSIGKKKNQWGWGQKSKVIKKV